MERRSEMPDWDDGAAGGDRSRLDDTLDELAGPRLDWQGTVRRYPLTSLLAATMGGFYLGRRYGWQMITDLSALAADELVRNVQQALDAGPE